MCYFAAIVFLTLSVLAPIHPIQAATCTISKYDESDIFDAINTCNEIILDGITVPAGTTLNLNLASESKLIFQGTTTWEFHEWNGPLINITGVQIEVTGAPNHVLDARGNLWWDGQGEHGGKIKPLFLVLQALREAVIHDLNIKNTPYHAIWIVNGDGIITNNITVDNKDGDTMGGHNTDGINVWNSENITLDRTTVYNQDDCIAIKSGHDIVVTDTYCYGGHGLSIGSVGGRDDNIVANVLVSNAEIVSSDNGVRIKTVYEATGSVTNVTYEDIVLKDINKFGIVVEGDYNIETGGTTGIATGGVPVTDFTLRNVTGTVKKSGVNVYILVKNASEWHWSGVDVTGGESTKVCDGIPEGSGISC